MSTSNEISSEFDQLRRSNEIVPLQTLDEIFLQLSPVAPEEMIGIWQGGYFKTGKLIDYTLKTYPLIHWYGKQFISKNKVKALIFKSGKFKFNIPLLGSAVIRPVTWQNTHSTAMIYSYLPIIDHFRRVNENTLMGLMEIKGKTILYFYLYRNSA